MNNYYNNIYYKWQKKSGELGALIDLWKFEKYIKKDDLVLDFGCGGGQILSRLHCRKKYGVEINTTASLEAQKNGIITFSTLDKVPKKLKFDVIISHHSLEHVQDPANILYQLKKYLKKKGKSIHIVPINDWRNDKTYNKNDINKHLFTWTPLLLGNLFSHCGYKIKRIEILTHAWLPLSKYSYPLLPRFLYHKLCVVWSILTRNRQIRIIATI